jgi:hypothetical protein
MRGDSHGELCAALGAIVHEAEGAELEAALRPWTEWTLAVRAGIYHRASATKALLVAERAHLAAPSIPSWAVPLARAAACAATAAIQAIDGDDAGARAALRATVDLIAATRSGKRPRGDRRQASPARARS